MNTQPNDSIDPLVSAMLDGHLSGEQRVALNQRLQESPDAVNRYHELLDNHEALCSIYPGEVYAESLDDEFVSRSVSDGPSHRPETWFGPSLKRMVMLLAIAASLLMTVGLAGYIVGNDRGKDRNSEAAVVGRQVEQTIAGHAMLRHSVALQWTTGAKSYRDGDVLPGGKLQIESGIAEIDFFCGATLTIEGPAVLDVQSDWSVKVASGRLRANVPPAARGFIVQTSEAEIIDLGTEFALDVGAESSRVEVIDGEVALRGGVHDGVHLTTGQHQWLGQQRAASGGDKISGFADLESRREDAEAERFSKWQAFSQKHQRDKRLIAYYKIADMPPGRTVPNAALSGVGKEATLVGPVQRSTGRFGQPSTGLEFDRIGARARTRIDGEFKAFTFSTWVRIDSLDHVYNALFMSDGYETGELHWQIRDDGSLMFSVMIDDTQEMHHFSERDGSLVKAAGLAKVYYTPPVWDISKSGRWFHLVAVYDPAGHRVTQYVNGELVSNEPINDKFTIENLKIGPAEIGNWGQPFRKTPWFSVRNLNGTIDEMTIYNAALEQDEIHNLYEQGKPLGY
ncbi:LamG-like jellyroll fold domain-containing protein [Neorhodopirellula pilleata]|uniref:FecR protein n=1 Tax=Neorhodopirellula pilleata TaxID=2714738 RepID=A0A5C5ZZE1_9BACT|nr:LamG-like jellyroll fold domain-containing protein [Neorhodopirellula pilleata]TWT91703.1 FecR protein [Neorhodopirellula pilleata]